MFVLLRYTDSDYSLDIFKLFLKNTKKKYIHDTQLVNHTDGDSTVWKLILNYLLLIKCSIQTFAKFLCRELLYINDWIQWYSDCHIPYPWVQTLLPHCAFRRENERSPEHAQLVTIIHINTLEVHFNIGEHIFQVVRNLFFCSHAKYAFTKNKYFKFNIV